MQSRLSARQIEVHYGPKTTSILSELSLTIQPGELLGVVGPNGSGKSTLVRALSRALRPDQGTILLDDADLYGALTARESARRIGVVPQDTSVSLDFTVREVVQMGRAPHLPRSPFAGESAEDGQIVCEASAAAGIAALSERLVTTLSGGERQRVLLARTLAQQPDVVLLDEPTAHLDLRHQNETMELALELAHGQGKAVLAVLHDLNLAAAHCDRLILLHEGHIAAQGTPREVLIADILQQVYGARVWVRVHPLTGRPWVLTLPELPISTLKTGAVTFHAHVICGGGTGAGLLVSLHQEGYFVTAGGLNDGDTDAEAAQMLGIPFAKEASFSPLSETTLAEAARLAASSDVVLLTEVPFGPANLGNLEAALSLCRDGKPVLCLQTSLSDFSGRDFTGGEATRLWEQLLSSGAVPVPGILSVKSWIHTHCAS